MYVAQYIMAIMVIVAIDRFRKDRSGIVPVRIQNFKDNAHNQVQDKQRKNGYLKATLNLEHIDQELHDLTYEYSHIESPENKEELDSLIQTTRTEFEDLKETFKAVETEKVTVGGNEVVLTFQIDDNVFYDDENDLFDEKAFIKIPSKALTQKTLKLSAKIISVRQCLQNRKLYLKSCNEKMQKNLKKKISRMSKSGYYEGYVHTEMEVFNVNFIGVLDNEIGILINVPFILATYQ